MQMDTNFNIVQLYQPVWNDFAILFLSFVKNLYLFENLGKKWNQKL